MGRGGAYLGSTGSFEWLDEPVYPLQDRCRTKGGQPGQHDEGQHLPKETDGTLGETAPRQSSRPKGSTGLHPTDPPSSPSRTLPKAPASPGLSFLLQKM